MGKFICYYSTESNTQTKNSSMCDQLYSCDRLEKQRKIEILSKVNYLFERIEYLNRWWRFNAYIIVDDVGVTNIKELCLLVSFDVINSRNEIEEKWIVKISRVGQRSIIRFEYIGADSKLESPVPQLVYLLGLLKAWGSPNARTLIC